MHRMHRNDSLALECRHRFVYRTPAQKLIDSCECSLCVNTFYPRTASQHPDNRHRRDILACIALWSCCSRSQAEHSLLRFHTHQEPYSGLRRILRPVDNQQRFRTAQHNAPLHIRVHPRIGRPRSSRVRTPSGCHYTPARQDIPHRTHIGRDQRTHRYLAHTVFACIHQPLGNCIQPDTPSLKCIRWHRRSLPRQRGGKLHHHRTQRRSCKPRRDPPQAHKSLHTHRKIGHLDNSYPRDKGWYRTPHTRRCRCM